jgi:hypothetical protein
MAKKQEKEGESTKKVFNFGDSPLMKKTEQNVVEGYNRIESEEKGGVGKPEPAAPVQQVEQPAANTAAAAEPEETKGIQAYIPMSLYERLVMRKLKTKEPLGSMFQQAMQLWIDVQEGKLTVQKV